MKKILLLKYPVFKYLIIGILLLQSIGCKKFLQVQPRDYMFEEEAFSTPKGVETVMNGLYQSLSDSMLYGSILSLDFIERMAQYYHVQPHQEYRLFLDPSDLQMLAGIWTNAYRNIKEVNNFCDRLLDPKFNVLPPEKRAILLGEAYALRAFLHFDQLRLFGPVYVKKPTALSIPYMQTASLEQQQILPAQEVINKIMHDLDTAIVLLEKDPVRTKGADRLSEPVDGASIDFMSNRHRRMNYFAVKTLAARVLLYAGKKAAAWDVVKSVLQAQEPFFPWQKEEQMASDPAMSKETFFGIENRNLYKNYRRLFSPLLKDDIILTPKPDRLLGLYNTASTDLRYKYWFKTGTEGDKAYKVFIKYNDASITDAKIKYYQPMIRKAELYLIAAETAPDLEQGFMYLNSLMVNKGLTPIDYRAGISTSAGLLTAIMAEYQREFIGEGQTFFMLKRFNTEMIFNVSGVDWKWMSEPDYVMNLPDIETYYRK